MVWVTMPEREDHWFERGIKEAIFVKIEQPRQQRGEGYHTIYLRGVKLAALSRTGHACPSSAKGENVMKRHMTAT